jgi:hypothetical protein
MNRRTNNLVKKKTKKCKRCGEVQDIINFKTNSRTKDGHISICSNCTSIKIKETRLNANYDHYYIYRFLNKDNEILYIGKTTNIDNRINAHLTASVSMSNQEKFELYENVYNIEYCEVESDYHMNIYEIHYICKYKTKYNIEFKSKNNNLFELPELNWQVYILKSYIDDCHLYYFCHFKLTYKDLKQKLLEDEKFYDEFLSEYLEDNRVHREFNPDSYEMNPDTGNYELIDFQSYDEDN